MKKSILQGALQIQRTGLEYIKRPKKIFLMKNKLVAALVKIIASASDSHEIGTRNMRIIIRTKKVSILRSDFALINVHCTLKILC